jgi:hypothetical protein
MSPASTSRGSPFSARAGLAGSFPQLGRNFGEADRGVDRALIGGRHELAAPPERGAAKGDSLARRMALELGEVGRASGRLDQHGTRVHRRRHDHLDQGSTGESERRPPLILPGELVDARKRGQSLEHLGRRLVGDEHDDDVAGDLGSAPDVPGDDRARDTLEP